MISIKNFFREDFSKVVGIYFDGEEIFLSRLDGENFSAHFEVEEENFSEQLAEKVSVLCSQRGWENSKVALCLREGDSIVLPLDFDNIPENQIEAAVQTWAAAQAGQNALSTFAKVDGEFCAETISQADAEKFIAAFEKNSMTLCAMTALIGKYWKPADKAKRAARIAAENNLPNLLLKNLSAWNFKKIFLFAAGILFLITSIVFGQIFYKFFTVQGELETLQKKLAALEDTAVLKENFDADVAAAKKLNALLASQADINKLNILIKIGQLANDKFRLTKINLSKDAAEIEGAAESSTDVKNLLGKLKSFISKNARLENISTEDDAVTFKIRLQF